MNAQRPDYRFPSMAAAAAMRDAARFLARHHRHYGLLARVAAAVVVARPDVHPVAALQSLHRATRRSITTGHAWQAATVAGVAIVLGADNPQPPQPPAGATRAAA